YLVELLYVHATATLQPLLSFPTRRSSDLTRVVHEDPAPRGRTRHRQRVCIAQTTPSRAPVRQVVGGLPGGVPAAAVLQEFCAARSEEHTSELQSRENLVCRLLLEKKKSKI